VPYWITGCRPSPVASSVVGTLTSTQVSSSAAMARSSMENPAPPKSAGMNDLVKPAWAISR
jgi:hypothetical protein